MCRVRRCTTPLYDDYIGSAAVIKREIVGRPLRPVWGAGVEIADRSQRAIVMGKRGRYNANIIGVHS
jgi:hypothetical protein